MVTFDSFKTHPQETILLQKNPDEFVVFDNSFSNKKVERPGALSVKRLKILLDNPNTKTTPIFLDVVRKYGSDELYSQALKKPKFNPSTDKTYQLTNPMADANYKKLLHWMDRETSVSQDVKDPPAAGTATKAAVPTVIQPQNEGIHGEGVNTQLNKALIAEEKAQVQEVRNQQILLEQSLKAQGIEPDQPIVAVDVDSFVLPQVTDVQNLPERLETVETLSKELRFEDSPDRDGATSVSSISGQSANDGGFSEVSADFEIGSAAGSDQGSESGSGSTPSGVRTISSSSSSSSSSEMSSQGPVREGDSQYDADSSGSSSSSGASSGVKVLAELEQEFGLDNFMKLTQHEWMDLIEKRVLDRRNAEQLSRFLRNSKGPLPSDEFSQLITQLESSKDDSSGQIWETSPSSTDPSSQLSDPLNSSQAIPGIPFAVDRPKREHPVKYHKYPILIYFGSIKNPEWDLELEKNIFESGLNKSETVTNIDTIIRTYGNQLFVYKRMSETLDELNELTQLQFCLLRHLQRGTRSKTATIPISSLVGFANKLSGTGPGTGRGHLNDPNFSSPTQPLGSDQVGPIPGQGGASVPQEEGFIEGSQFGEQTNQSIQQIGGVQGPLIGPQDQESTQVQLDPSEAISNIIDAFRNRPYDSYGKPRINQDIIQEVRKKHVEEVKGSGSLVDPCDTYIKAPRSLKIKIVEESEEDSVVIKVHK